MKHHLIWVAAVGLVAAGCGGGSEPQAVVTVTASPTAVASVEPTPEPVVEDTEPALSCKQASKDAMKVSRQNNKGTVNPVMIAVIRIKGPVVDKTLDPPRNGDFYVCTGTGVFSSGGNVKVRFGYTRKGGQYFTFYKEV